MNANKIANYTDTSKARELQMTLYLCAKESPNRRFHALYDKIYRPDILWNAWQSVKKNKGSGGIDGLTIQSIVEEYGERKFMNELYTELKNKSYRPSPVLRTFIPKEDGKKRPLGIPTIKDRIVQMATKMVIEPIFEADFRDCSFGFRPNRNAHQAIKRIKRVCGNSNWVVDVDIQGYFDNINQIKLMKLVEQRISDKRILKLIRKWLEAGVMEEGKIKDTIIGTPQGGVISPLLANIYLNTMDTLWEKKFSHLGVLVRYADDFVILCKSKGCAIESIQAMLAIMEKLDLQINRNKSRLVNLWDGKDGFDFLGFHNRKFPGRRLARGTYYYMSHIPKKNAMKKMRAKIKEFTSSKYKLRLDLKDLVIGLNRRLRGFRNYYQISPHSKIRLNQIDWYVLERLTLFYNRKVSNRKKHGNMKPVLDQVGYLIVKLAK
ncbi:MAG: group II intron reverse transcriptase/maturase [Bacilli bacterium]